MTRQEYIDAAGGLAAAIAFENATLSIGREHLPPCALAVLDGGEGTPEYWAWLAGAIDSSDAASDAEPAAGA